MKTTSFTTRLDTDLKQSFRSPAINIIGHAGDCIS